MNHDKRQIWTWMRSHVQEHVDECNEVNCTSLVEAWDHACASGDETLDPSHVAWDVAIDVEGWWTRH